MNKQINYRFFHWGPFLYKTKIEDEELKKIKLLCKKDKTKDYRVNLAGLIKNEYEINEKKLFPIIAPYVRSYLQAAYEHYGFKYGKSIVLESSWVNFMTKYESNPIHIHDGDLSFVLFLKIPKKLNEEIKENKAKAIPGSLCFVHKLEKNIFSIGSHEFSPEKGDFFIFPPTLHHYVCSFKSEGERISISGNFKINYER